MFLSSYFTFCVVMCVFINSVTVITQELKYKVIAPEYICSKENMSQTAIRLIGEDVPYLKYNWSVSFHLDELKESNNLKQRHIIMIWNSVRNLNNILQTMSKDDINKGVIFINNSMFTPDVQYIINLTVQKQQNGTIKTDAQQIALEYIDKNSKKSSLSASLLGPEVTYSDLPYTAKAEVSSCNDISDYQLSWQLLDKSKKMLREESSNSRILQLPPGTLSSGNEYSIKCLVLDKKTNKNKSSDALRVNVLERGMQLSTYTKHLKIGSSQPIYLNAFFNDPDCGAGVLTFIWKCKNSANKACEEFENSNSTELSIPEGFSKPGRYLFSVTAKKGSGSVEDSSVVEIAEEMLPVIDVENAMTSCSPSDGVKISAHVSRLVPGCTLQWSSVDEKEYEVVDLAKTPGNPGEPLELTEDDDDNLETLSEENNNENEIFIDKQHDLLLSSSKDGSWKGLQSNSKYLFRLTASCPCLENSSKSREEKFVVSSADITVTTFKLPLIKPLKINPKSGQAMRTIFSFETDEPVNSPKPLLYKFGIMNKSKKKLFLIKQYDETVAVTILPFYEESIQTILEVCDSKSACNFTMGPKVIVKLPNNFAVAETNSLITNFNKSMLEQDYFNAFTLSSILIQTANKMSSKNTFNLFDSSIKSITKREIKSFLSATDDSWLLPASNLLKHIKILGNDIQMPEDMLTDILALRDKISEKQNSLRKKQSKSEKLIAPSRKLLSLGVRKKSKRIVNEINIDEIKDYLEISELAIKRLTDFERVDTEKQKLLEKLQYYIPRICQFLYNNYKTNVRIELSSVVFDVEKINLARKFNEFIFVPFDMNLAAKLQLGRDLAEKFRRRNGMCLGKILFLDDYFHIPQYVFDIKLYNAMSDHYLDSDINNFVVTVEMPVKRAASSNQMFQCVLWQNGNWDISKCRTLSEFSGKVKCACKSLGYFSMVPVERTTTTSTTTSSTSTRSTTTTTKRVVDLVTQQYNVETAVLTTVTDTVTVPNVLVTNEQIHGTVIPPTLIQLITSTEQMIQQKSHENLQNSETNIKAAGVWSISILSVGIFTLLLACLVVLRKLQRSKAVQNLQTIEYARYFDEHNLE